MWGLLSVSVSWKGSKPVAFQLGQCSGGGAGSSNLAGREGPEGERPLTQAS